MALTETQSESILFVDDEALLLNAMQRRFSKLYNVTIATSGKEAIRVYEEQGPFSVVVTDNKMPGMYGLELLEKLYEKDSCLTGILLTGGDYVQEELKKTERPYIFNFLCKPAMHEQLKITIASGVRQYRLNEQLQALQKKTLPAVVKVLMDSLSVSKPEAFLPSVRLAERVKRMVEELGCELCWEIEIASMLAFIGMISIPEKIVSKHFSEESLSDEECQQFQTYPEVSYQLINPIPGLELVSHIVKNQLKNVDELKSCEDEIGLGVSVGSRVLKTLIDYDELRVNNIGHPEVIEILLGSSHYDSDIVAVCDLCLQEDESEANEEVSLPKLKSVKRGVHV